MFNDKWLIYGYFTAPEKFVCVYTCFLTNAVPENDPSENAPAGIPLVQQINFGPIVNGQRRSQIRKSGFGFFGFQIQRILFEKGFTRSKIRIWICTKEREIHFNIRRKEHTLNNFVLCLVGTVSQRLIKIS